MSKQEKLNSNQIAELGTQFSPRAMIVDKLPNAKSVKDFTRIYKKKSNGNFDSYRMLSGKWIKTGSDMSEG